jgi:hypothetical protein
MLWNILLLLEHKSGDFELSELVLKLCFPNITEYFSKIYATVKTG